MSTTIIKHWDISQFLKQLQLAVDSAVELWDETKRDTGKELAELSEMYKAIEAKHPLTAGTSDKQYSYDHDFCKDILELLGTEQAATVGNHLWKGILEIGLRLVNFQSEVASEASASGTEPACPE